MDALILRVMLISVTLFVSTGAGFRTRNFVVTAPTAEEARTVAEAAEEYRYRLSVFWTGQPLPNWSRPCTIRVRSGSYGAAGQTTFQFVGGEVLNWKMMVQGTSERILDSVLPHEVNHTIFASHFRRPLPRWADEGASTLFEHRSEQRLQLDLLQTVVRKRSEYIPLRRLLSMKQYPSGHRPMLILYAEGFGLVDFLMQQRGRETYLKFLADARNGQWEAAIRKHYNHKGVEALEKDWRAWVIAGMPRYGVSPDEMIASLGPETRDAARPVAHNDSVQPASFQNQNRQESASRTRSAQPSNSSRSSRTTNESPDSFVSASRKLAEFKKNRRFTVEAPRLGRLPDSSPRDTNSPEDSSSDGKEPLGGELDTFPQPSRKFESTSEPSPVPFPDGSSFQPTNHQSRTESDRRLNGAGLLWRRDEDTGSTPQWAGFPGQTELF